MILHSIEAEVHPDYKKGIDGKRSIENGYNNDKLIHRFYGAISLDGEVYRVKTTIQESVTPTEKLKAHSYEVTEIELLPESNSSTLEPTASDYQGQLPHGIAKLLNGVEKSYDPGKKLLDESGSGDMRYREESEQSGHSERLHHGAALQSVGDTENSEAKRSHAEKMAEKFNTPITIIEDVEKLPTALRDKKGGYDVQKGSVVVVLPNHATVEDVAETVLHEVVGHKGLRELIGEENYDAFCDEIYRHLNAELKGQVDMDATRRFMREPEAGHEHHRRVAVDELLGRLAEKDFEDFTVAERGIWAKLKAKVLEAINKFLGSLKLPKWVRLGDNELRYMLWCSHEKLRTKGDYVDMARDAAKREELGLTVNDAIRLQDEAKTTADKIEETFNAAVSGDLKGKPVEIGRLTKEGKAYLEKLSGMEMKEKVSFVLNPSDLGHIYRRHFGKNETDSRNIPLTTEDIRRMADIVANPDRIMFGKETGGNQRNMFFFLKEADNGSYNLMEVYSDRKGNLTAKSFFKSKEGVSQRAMLLNESSTLTSVTDGATLSDGAKLPKIFDNPTIGEGESSIYRFRDGETDDIWKDRSVGLEERITNAALRLSNNQSDDLTLRNEAQRAVVKNLQSLLHEMRNRRGMARSFTGADRKVEAGVTDAMNAQAVYDRVMVKRVTDLGRILMQTGYLSGMTSGEMQRLLSAVKNAASMHDVSESVQKIMDIMVDNQLRNGEGALRRLLSIRGSKVDARGVEVQGALDPDGQRTMEVVKKAMPLTEDDITDRIAEALNRMSDPDHTIADQAAIEYAGLNMAMDYVQNIAGSKAEEKTLRDSLKTAKEDKDAGRMTVAAYKQFVGATEDAIRKNKVERAEAYFNLVGRLSDSLRESIDNARAFREAEKARVREIHHNANSDMEGRPSKGHQEDSRLTKLNNKAGVRLGLGPLTNLDQMLRSFGGKNPDGKGYLWNHYMRGWIDSADREQLMKEKYNGMLDKKAKDIFGERKVVLSGKLISVPYKFMDIYTYASALPKSGVTYYDGAEMRKYQLSQPQLLYMYAVEKMLMGRATNRRMGITDEVMEQIENFLDPKLKAFADWAQEDLLPELGAEMNELHRRMFGADMDDIEHYFPFVRDKDALEKTIENGDKKSPNNRINTVTGAIKKRKASVAVWDIPNCNFFDVLAHHISEGCHWTSFAGLNRDFGTLLSYNRFKQQVMGMDTIFGSGKKLWSEFSKTCAIATDSYDPETSDADRSIMKIAKNIALSKIAFNPMPALKQLLSLPAFAGETDLGVLAADLAQLGIPAIKWAWENMPNYRKRVQSRTVGDYYLSNSAADANKSWIDELQKLMSKGMYPNIGVDAWTIAVGCHGVYVKSKKKYLRQRYAEERAERMAVQDAELCFNKSQQSSEGPFMAPVQIDHTFFGTSMMLFRNSSTSYSREFTASVRNLKHMIDGTVNIDYMTKQILRSAEIPTYSQRFDNDLEKQIEGKLPQGYIYSLGMPGGILQSAGFPDAPIEMSATRLAEKSSQENHPFPLDAIKGLVSALNSPIAVLKYGNNAMNVIVGLQYKGKQFLVGVHFNQHRGGSEISSVRGLFPKDNAEWINWISQGKAAYLDHKKIQALIDQQRIDLADVEYLDLNNVAKVMENFINPVIPDQKKWSEWRDEDVRYARKEAKRELRSAAIRNFVNANMFGFILPWLWRIGGISPLLLLGGDDDKKEAVKDTISHLPFGFVEGFGYGDVLSDAIVTGFGKLTGDKNVRWKNVGRSNPLLSDLTTVLRHMDTDFALGCNDIVNIIVSSVSGASPQLIANWTSAFMDKCGGDRNFANEWGIFVARLLNAPQSQLDKIYFDEVDLTGEEAGKLTPEQLAQRFAEYKVKRGYFFAPWVWDDEALLKKKGNQATERLTERLKAHGDKEVIKAYADLEERYKAMKKKRTAAYELMDTDYTEGAKARAALREDPDYGLYGRFGKLNRDLNELTKRWLKAESQEEAAAAAKAITAYRAAMVRALDAETEDERQSAREETGRIISAFKRSE